MKTWTAAPAVLALLVPLAVMANEQLAKEKQCDQCHKVAEPSKGPSWHLVAQRWKGRANAQELLTKQIQDGNASTPHWSGKVTMPDTTKRPPVSNAEAHELIAWILAQ
ncbi:MAG TPA: c-type cytochrome [Ramlibacter sp.]